MKHWIVKRTWENENFDARHPGKPVEEIVMASGTLDELEFRFRMKLMELISMRGSDETEPEASGFNYSLVIGDTLSFTVVYARSGKIYYDKYSIETEL